jgi:ectoine hydroxylase-related dioxygenase (phytanoyl-CoA dioxygenase family)
MLECNGFEILKQFVSQDILEAIKEEVSEYSTMSPKYGIRSADKKFSTIFHLMNSSLLVNKATEILGSKPKVVRVIYFDKTEESNWLVPWHQDRTIALNKKVEVEGWGRWSVKDGVHHVQPSIDVLEQMITFRVHLDDSDRTNGCLKIVPNTHTLGLLNQEQIREVTSNRMHSCCEVKVGDVLLMRPHILHASSKCIRPKHRRIVHIEYSSYALPFDLEWA